MKNNSVVSPQIRKDLLAGMVRIRKAEEKIVEVYGEHQMRTPTHLSIGQEAVAVGVCRSLRKEDQVFAAHRCHAVFLAKGGKLDGFFAELCGRANGVNGGRGGSAHLSDPQSGMYASPILGGMIPVAVGAALSFKMNRAKRIAVTFFGDAAIEEGAFAESVNFAVVKKLPILFICENNLYSTHSHLRERQPASSIYKRMLPELKPQQFDGNDVEVVFKTAKKAIEHCRGGNGPVFLEYLTYRFREHVGPLYDHDKGYRTKAEVEAWKKRCPIKRYENFLLKKKTMKKDEMASLAADFEHQSTQAYQKALESPWPSKESAMADVY